jgi:PAS domain S-box-containing protein
LRAIIESEPECVKLLGADGTLLEMNAAGLRMIEADSLGQLINQSVYLLVAEEDRSAFRNLTERVFEGESGSLAFRLVGLRGTRRWLETHATPLRDEQGVVTALLGVTRDITESRRAQLHLAQINRTYAVMSDINKLIVRERDPQAIFEGACRIAVERGGFLMAWVGLTQGHAEPLTIAAHAGAAPDVVALLQDICGTPHEGCAFTSRAVVDGVPAVCNDVELDPLSVVWRDAALQRGYRSMVSLPLTMTGRRVGVFNLYAAEAEFFDDGELRLLNELATDIGFALEVTERERERLHAEAALRASEERFRELAETIEDVFWVADPHARRILYVSPAYERIWGRSRAALYESPDIGWTTCTRKIVDAPGKA